MGAYFQYLDGSLEFDVVTDESHEGILVVTEHPIEKGANIADHAIPQNAKCTITGLVTNTPIDNRIKSGSVANVEVDVPIVTYFGKIVEVQRKKYRAVPPLNPAGFAIGALETGIDILSDEISGPMQFPVQDSRTDVTKRSLTVLQFDQDFDRVSEVLYQLEDLQQRKVIGTLITPKRSYENMILQHYTAPRKAKAKGSITVTCDFVQVQIVNTEIVSAPKPLQERGKRAQAKGKQDAPKAEPEPKEPKSAGARIKDSFPALEGFLPKP